MINTEYLEQTSLNAEWDVMLEMCSILTKEAKMSQYYQEGLKEAWDSDTSAIHGREGEGIGWRILKFLPRLIRNVIKMIGNAIKKLFKKDKREEKDTKTINEYTPSEEDKKEFVEELSSDKPEEDTSDKDSHVKRYKEYVSAINKLRKFIDLSKFSATSMRGGKMTPENLYDAVFNKKQEISCFNLKSAAECIDVTQDAISIMNKDVMKLFYDKKLADSNKLGTKVNKISQGLNTAIHKFKQVSSYFKDKNQDGDIIAFTVLFTVDNKIYDAFVKGYTDKLTKIEEQLNSLYKQFNAPLTQGKTDVASHIADTYARADELYSQGYNKIKNDVVERSHKENPDLPKEEIGKKFDTSEKPHAIIMRNKAESEGNRVSEVMNNHITELEQITNLLKDTGTVITNISAAYVNNKSIKHDLAIIISEIGKNGTGNLANVPENKEQSGQSAQQLFQRSHY